MLISVAAWAQSAQIIANEGQWNGNFTHRMELAHGAMFFESNGYSMVLADELHRHGTVHGNHQHSNKPAAIAFRMRFKGANPRAQTYGTDPLDHKVNYILGNDSTRWKSDLRVDQKLNYLEIYPGINIEYYAQGDRLKYDFFISPGSNPGQIIMNYQGLKSLSLQEGILQLQTDLGPLMESIPEAYQIINGTKHQVKCKYTLIDNQVSFQLGKYNPDYSLVIDPVLDFSSFSGSADLNFGHSATPGVKGTTYAAGVNFGVNYPTTVGSFQPSFAADSVFNVDVTISKFSATGSSLMYATYLGGRDIDIVCSMIADDDDNLYILGTTGSNDFPVNDDAFQNNFEGGPIIPSYSFNDFNKGTDIFISKLNSTGSTLLASTFWGGSDNDGYNYIEENYGDHFRGEIILDGQKHVAVLSSSRSADLPMPNQANNPKSSSSQDAALARFTPDLQQQLWGSFFGGSNLDAGYSLKANNQEIYITGGTRSTDLPLISGAYQSSLKGSMDGFIAAFQENTGQLTKATYYGTDTTDQSFLMDFDRFGGLYLFGQTSGNIPITTGKYGEPHASQFVTKFQPSLTSIEWQTAIGSGQSKQDLVPAAFMVDQCQNIYLSGWNGKANMVGFPSSQNGNTHGLPVSPDAYQPLTDGSDFYFMILKRESEDLLYGSYLGGTDNEHVDGGTSRFSKDGIIHQAVCTNCNNRGFPTTPGSYSPQAGGPSCNMMVFKFSFDQVLDADAQISFTTGVDSICDALVVNFDNYSLNATNYKWYFGNGDSSSLAKPTITYPELGEYKVKLIAYDSICGVNDTVEITISHTEASFPDAIISSEYEDCDAQFQANFNADKSTKSQSYHWYFGDGNESTLKKAAHQFNSPGPHEVMLIANDTVCHRSDTSFVTVNFTDSIPEPEGGLSISDCSNGSLDVDINNHRQWYEYQWIVEGKAYNGLNPDIRFDHPGRKEITLLVTDSVCNKNFELNYSLMLEAIKKETYLPTAFTPDGDGLNDKFEIFGDECEEGNLLKIFNRWGELVYSTPQPYKEFWDGRFKGAKVPAGVYSYVLLTAEEKIQGSFTLIR